MRELFCFIATAFFLAGGLCAFWYEHLRPQRPQPKPLAVTAPDSQPPTPPPLLAPAPPEPPAPPVASVAYVGEDAWTVVLPADGAWFNTRIPVGPHYQVWIEPSEPVADCQFLAMVGGQVFSSEVVTEQDALDTQRIIHLFPWSEMPSDVPVWVEPVKLKLAPSCRRESLALDIESTSLLEPDNPLFQLEENAERRQRVLASQAAAHYLQQLFQSRVEK